LQDLEAQTRTGVQGCIEVFEYPAGPEPSLPAEPDGLEAEGSEPAVPGKPSETFEEAAVASLRAEHDRRLAEETRRAFDAGREKGRLEGRVAEREDQAAAQSATEERRRSQAVELIESFAQERDRYLLAVEHEVVELALAIAARILRREAQMDPLLLTGAVRVALGQLVGTTKVRLLVPSEELDLWTEAIASIPNLAVRPTVIAGEEMRTGDCAIETELGTVDLGVRAQMGEIERGFFDRTGSRSAHLAVVGESSQEPSQDPRR
jgi:flagellar assembly protein FliH